MLEELRRHNAIVQERIMKSFGYADIEDFIKKGEDEIELIQKGEIDYDWELEKAVYADTAQNRRLNRVGQEYHRGRGKKEEKNDMRNADGRMNKNSKLVQRMWSLQHKVDDGKASDEERKEYATLRGMAIGKSKEEVIKEYEERLQKTKEDKKSSGDKESEYDAQKLEGKDLNDVKQKYGVSARTNRFGEISLRIESKKEVKNLKKFLNDNGIKFDESKLIREKGFHGTHYYSYDLYAGGHENSVGYYERKAKFIQSDIDWLKNELSKPGLHHISRQSYKQAIPEHERELADVNKKIAHLKKGSDK